VETLKKRIKPERAFSGLMQKYFPMFSAATAYR
jgi:hypothetical protein